MSSYPITTTLNQPYPAAVDAVRIALGDQGSACSPISTSRPH